MLKNISNLGKTLSKTEQKTISGGKLEQDLCLPTCGFMTCLNSHGRCAPASFDEWQACSWNDIINCNH